MQASSTSDKDMNTRITNIKAGYSRALIEGEKRTCQSIIEAAIQAGVGPRELYTKVVIPCQVSLGALWADGKISVSQEHLATQLTIDQMDYLRAKIQDKPSIGKKAIVTTVEGDKHYLGARVIADFLKFDGWEVDFLGTDIPTDDLVDFIKERKDSLVCISVTLPQYFKEARKVIAAAKKLDHPVKVLLGGSAIRFDPVSAKETGADGLAMTIDEALPLAKKLVGVGQGPVDLKGYLKTVGGNIKKTRKRQMLSQSVLAKSCGLDRAYISSVENGKHNITIGALVRIASSLSVPVEQLISDNGLH